MRYYLLALIGLLSLILIAYICHYFSHYIFKQDLDKMCSALNVALPRNDVSEVSREHAVHTSLFWGCDFLPYWLDLSHGWLLTITSFKLSLTSQIWIFIIVVLVFTINIQHQPKSWHWMEALISSLPEPSSRYSEKEILRFLEMSVCDGVKLKVMLTLKKPCDFISLIASLLSESLLVSPSGKICCFKLRIIVIQTWKPAKVIIKYKF